MGDGGAGVKPLAAGAIEPSGRPSESASPKRQLTLFPCRSRARRAGVGGNPRWIQNATCVMYFSCRRARSQAPKSRMRYAPPPHRCFTVS